MGLPFDWIFHLVILASIRFEHHVVLASGQQNGASTPLPTHPSAQLLPVPSHIPSNGLRLSLAIPGGTFQEPPTALTPHFPIPTLSAVPHSGHPPLGANALGLLFFTPQDMDRMRLATASNTPASTTHLTLPPGPHVTVLPPLVIPVPRRLHMPTEFLTQLSRATRSSTTPSQYESARSGSGWISEFRSGTITPPPVADMFANDFPVVSPGGNRTPPPNYAGIRQGHIRGHELIATTPFGMTIVNTIQ